MASNNEFQIGTELDSLEQKFDYLINLECLIKNTVSRKQDERNKFVETLVFTRLFKTKRSLRR